MWREMRRTQNQIPREEAEQILANGRRGTLAVLGENGYPYAIPMNYVYEDGAILFHGAPEGHKIDAIAACNQASFAVISEPTQNEGEWWLCFRSAIAFGRIHLVEDEDAKRAILWKLAEKYWPTLEGEEEHIERSIPRVACLRLEIEHLTGKSIREK